MVNSRYVDRFERRDGDWRIAHRVALTDSARTNTVAPWERHLADLVDDPRHPGSRRPGLPPVAALVRGRIRIGCQRVSCMSR